jgi:LAT3 family solute carrier family 43 protein 3
MSSLPAAASSSDAAPTTTSVSTATTPRIEPTIQYGAADGEANVLERQGVDLSDCEPPPSLEEKEHALKTIKADIDLRAMGLFAFAFLTISVASGTVYGWPSLRRHLLKEEGSTLDESSFGIIYTCGSWATQACRFFFGLARDYEKGGTKRTTCASLLCVAAGAFGIAMSGPNDKVALSISMFFMGMGSGTQLCLQPVAGMFPDNVQGLLISTLSGAFQLAGLVFVALTAATTDRRAAFTTFALLIIILTVVAAVILPYGNFASTPTKETEIEEMISIVHDDQQSLEQRQTNIANDECRDLTGEKLMDPRDDGLADNDIAAHDTIADCRGTIGGIAPHQDKPVAAILRTAEYILLLVWFSISLVPLQYYIGTIGFQLDQRGDENGRFTTMFSIIYAASAGVAPFLGKLADVAGLGISQGLSSIFVAISLFMLASTTISLEVHAVGMGFYGVGRMMIFGTYFTNVGKRFGYKSYGALSGLGLLTSGIVSLLQYPLIATATNGYHSAVDVGCGVVMVALLPYCLWLATVERRNNS